MSRRGTRTVGLLASVASLAVLAACAGAPAGSGGDDGVGDGADGAVADDGAGGGAAGGGAAGGIMPAEVPAPSELVGLWRVTGDGAPTEDTWVQIGSPFSPGEVTVWAGCGVLHGTWTARAGALLATVDGWSGSCDGADAAAWLEASVAYGPAGDGIALIDADGIEHVTLTVDGEPAARDDVDDAYRQQPALDDEQVAQLDAAPTPPADLAPASYDAVLGRWVPATTYETEPFLELVDDGTYTGSDGCNGTAGRWALAGDGSVLATTGMQTLMACDGESLAASLAQAAWLVVDGDRLAFVADDGSVLTEAVRG